MTAENYDTFLPQFKKSINNHQQRRFRRKTLLIKNKMLFDLGQTLPYFYQMPNPKTDKV